MRKSCSRGENFWAGGDGTVKLRFLAGVGVWFAGGGAAITMMTFAATYSHILTIFGVQVSAVAAVTAFVSEMD